MTTVNDGIASLKAATSLDSLDQELTTIANGIVPLTKQTPFTLLMMRVVEIGLPVLLSLVSVFFLLRYSLTEKRSLEIKNLLKQRNEARSKEAKDAPGAVTV
jgi:Na+/melibiose symporter-like transporter